MSSNNLDLFGPRLMPNAGSAAVPEIDLLAFSDFQSAPLEAATSSGSHPQVCFLDLLQKLSLPSNIFVAQIVFHLLQLFAIKIPLKYDILSFTKMVIGQCSNSEDS